MEVDDEESCQLSAVSRQEEGDKDDKKAVSGQHSAFSWMEDVEAPGVEYAGRDRVDHGVGAHCPSVGRWMMQSGSWMDAVSCLLVLGMLLFGAWSLIGPIGSTSSKSELKTEQGYLIRRKKDGYPMTVNAKTLSKALGTKDYEYEGRATYETAGGFFYNNGYIPGGDILVEDCQYQDDRLN